MAKNVIRTSKQVASKASRALRSTILSKKIKSIIASDLVNRKKNSK